MTDALGELQHGLGRCLDPHEALLSAGNMLPATTTVVASDDLSIALAEVRAPLAEARQLIAHEPGSPHGATSGSFTPPEHAVGPAEPPPEEGRRRSVRVPLKPR